MRYLNSLFAVCLVVMVLAACTSTLSKMNGDVKAKAQKIADVGKYRVAGLSKDNPHNTAGCECASKVAIVLQPDDKKKDQVLLCIGKGHSALSDYDSLSKGDPIQLEVTETMMDLDCSSDPGTFLRPKK